MNPDLKAIANAQVLLQAAEARREPSRRYVPHRPTLKQSQFLALDCLEAFYGGAAGGGKTDGLLMSALQYVHVPGYAALLLRRKGPDLVLPGALLDRAHAWLKGTAAVWEPENMTFSFPTGGEPATLTFGFYNRERDFDRYQGLGLQMIGFEELTQFPERWYRKLFSRLRRLIGQPVPLRMRAVGNPGGIGHEWVRRRFIDEKTSIDPKTKRRRVFVPATRRDNPHVDQDAYEIALAELDETTRKQLDEGIWIADSGGLVYAFNGLENRAPRGFRRGDDWSYVLGVDYGFDDATAFAVLGWAPHDTTVYVVESFKLSGMTPGDAADTAKKLEQTYHFDRIVGDVGGLGKGYAEEAKQRFHIPIEAAQKKNKRGYIELFNGDLKAGRIKLMAGNDQLETEWSELAWKEDRSAEAPGFDNHIADAVLYAWRSAAAFTEEPDKEKPAPLTPEQRIAARLAAVQEAEDDMIADADYESAHPVRHFSQRLTGARRR